MAGDSHLVVEFGNTIELSMNQKVHTLAKCLMSQDIQGLCEVVPTYRSLLISFDPLVLDVIKLQEYCSSCLEGASINTVRKREIVKIPTIYGGQYGVDLAAVAREVELTEQEVIDIHTAGTYPIYMIGFMPGYPYLGGLDERIAVPRLKVPRTKVQQGSVAIAEKQTGVYPLASPGGWRLIGRTPLKLYTPEKNPPSLCRAGQYIRFYAITVEEYHSILEQVANNEYVPEIITEEAE